MNKVCTLSIAESAICHVLFLNAVYLVFEHRVPLSSAIDVGAPLSVAAEDKREKRSQTRREIERAHTSTRTYLVPTKA